MSNRQAEWNAEHYHVVSRPHEQWGASVLSRVPKTPIATVLDAGCGTGKITRELLDLLPSARVTAVDYSPAMLDVAERELGAVYGDRVQFAQVDLSTANALDQPDRFDLIFSTATFHWIHDHQRLFNLLHDWLNPGGWLIAQCGGGPNLAQARAFAGELMSGPEFGRYFSDWTEPWVYEDDVTTLSQLTTAGFTDVNTWLEEQPTDMGDAETYRQYVRTVIFREHLAKLPDEQTRSSFVEALVDHAAQEQPPFVLDYWRLNMNARRPVII